jgi:hypothetical protein
MPKDPVSPEKQAKFKEELRRMLKHGHTLTVVVNRTSSTKSYRAQVLVSVVDASTSEGTAIKEITYQVGCLLPYDFDNAQIKVPLEAAGILAGAELLAYKLSEAVFGTGGILKAVIV